jgi:hypothetical protein
MRFHAFTMDKARKPSIDEHSLPRSASKVVGSKKLI